MYGQMSESGENSNPRIKNFVANYKMYVSSTLLKRLQTALCVGIVRSSCRVCTATIMMTLITIDIDVYNDVR